MPLSKEQRFRFLELERERAMHMEAQAAPQSAELPSERFAKYAEPISAFGGMFAKTGPIGAGMAGAASMGAEIGRQAIQAVGSEPGYPTTFAESGKRIAGAFAKGAAGEGLARGVFAGAGMLGKKLIKPGAQLMKVSAGIPEQAGVKVLSDPSVLSRAKSVEQAGADYAKAMEATGLKQGPEAAMEMMGKQALSTEGAAGFAYDAIGKLNKGELSYQEALVARDQIKNILKMPKWQNPSVAQNEKFLISMRDTLDNYLEPYFQSAGESFGAARAGYADAMTKRDFTSWFPTNANKSASVLRGTLAAGAAGAGIGGYVSPETAVAGMAMASPKMLGYGIRAAASPITLEAAKFGTRLAAREGAGELITSTEALMKKHYEAQR